ncbi:MAG: VWA domain-containing protein [Treponema sp.]|nr:VWA domain-containing protein [Treponema sp.]
MPNFQNPAAFILLLTIPLIYILRAFKIFNRVSFPAVLADWQGKHFEWKGRSHKFLSILARISLIIGYIIVIAAFADPVISHQEKVYTSLGADIVFVVDTSPSMAAEDVNGEMRLEAAKKSIASLSQAHDGYRFGIVALGSNASVLVPPTSDSNYFSDCLNKLSVGMMGDGSAIGDGLSTAICHLVSSSAPKKCIVLLTDGVNNAGEIHPETAAKLGQENDITIYVLGLGSKGSGSIKYTDPKTGKEYSGTYDSNFSSAPLKKIASIGKGKYFEVRTLEELSATLSTVAKIENISQHFTYKTVNTTYYQKFLFVSMFLFAIAWFIKRILLKEMICYRYKKILWLRTAFLAFCLIMLILAYKGLTWGTYLVPVQKSGTAVSMVFDISNSMMAKDGPKGTTRLRAASIYAKKLLTKMSGVSTSVVLAKGDGVVAIPLTEDKALIESLLEVMNPKLMTVPGSSIGKGIIKAINTFPTNYSSAGRIWVFTDGEETDGQLQEAFSECLKSGIPVTIIGFGQEKESSVLAGDGVTEVYTALRSVEINNAIQTASEKFNLFKNRAEITYINSNDRGSAISLLSQLKLANQESLITSYEAKPVPRYKLFLFLAILSFIMSYIITEMDFARFFKNHKLPLAGLCLFTIFFSSCSNKSLKVLDGSRAYQSKNYRRSVSRFMDVLEEAKEEENQDIVNYSLYDLGTAYLMLGEDEAAMQRLEEISKDAPDSVRYAAFYNAGIIAHKNQKYEEAQNYFKQAIEIDNTKVDAKINMELSMQMTESKVKEKESQAKTANMDEEKLPDIENAIFQHIKENDQKQWKNSESNQPQDLAEDY